MKVTFVRPSMMRGAAGDSLEPLVFAILSGLTPPEIDRVLYDDRLEVIPYDEPTDLVALTVETATAKRAYQIASEYHRRGVPVVMGGCHPTLAPDEALGYASSIVIGDAEGVWGDVVDDAARGALKPVYERRAPDLNGVPVDRSIFRGKRYGPLALVQFGRGCRFSCEFCSVRAFYGSNIRHRPVRQVVDEVRRLRRRHVFFVDDNLFVDRDRSRQLLEALIPLRVRWSCQASLDTTVDQGLLRLMQRSGCLLVIVGFESMNRENLEQMGKQWNLRQGGYAEVVRAFHDHGIMVYGTFVFGYDHDTVDSFDTALEFAIGSKLCLANFNPLCPTPATPLYDRLKDEGRLINDPWWLHPDYRYGQSMLRPLRMTARDLELGCYRARSRFNTYGCILQRSFARGANGKFSNRPGFSLLVNLVSRRQIHGKQSMPLGDGDAPVPVYQEASG
jgi:radical SAM superfamily enzyme YgiQ (UPF0313 family)